MDEKKLADFLFEMSEKSRETTMGLFGSDRYYDGFAAGINVAATTVKTRMYEESTAEECAKQALFAATMADLFVDLLDARPSDD